MLKKITRAVTVSALFLIPIFPLIVVDSFFFPFITGKAFYFRILVELAFASWVILAFLDAKYRPRINKLTIAVTVFALVALAANLLGANPIRSMWSNFERMEGWITIIHLWMFYVLASSMFAGELDKNGKPAPGGGESLKWWHRWFKMFLTVGTIVGLYGFAQLFGWAAIHQGSTRIDASLGNAAYMAVYMLMNAGIAFYMFLVAKQDGSNKSSGSQEGRKPKLSFMAWVYLVLAVIFSFLLFETATRGTILGLTGGILLALFLYGVFGKNETGKARRRAFMGIGAIVLIGAVFWFSRGSSFVKNSEVLNRLASISWSEAQGQARNYVWPMALKGWTERPVLGWGQENFNYIFNYDYDPHMWSQEQWFDRAHSVFLDWLVAGGAVGLAAYLALYVLLFGAIWKSDLSLAKRCALAGLVAAYAIHNVFVFDNLASYVAFFALLAFAGSALIKVRPREARSDIAYIREFNPEIVEYLVAPISIIVLVVSFYFFTVRAASANSRLIVALQSCASANPDVSLFDKALAVNAYVANQEIREQMLSCAGSVISNQQIPGPAKQAFFTAADKAINDQITAAPKDARMYVLGGQFLNSMGQVALAEPLMEKAHLLTPGKQTVDMGLADDYLNTGKPEQAMVLLRQAYEADPSYPQARNSYAIGLIVTGQEALARQLFHDDPAIFETEQLAGIYAALKNYGKAIAIYQALIAKNPTDANLRLRLAQSQYLAGLTSQAVATLKAIEKDHPEYKDQIEAAIKTVQK